MPAPSPKQIPCTGPSVDSEVGEQNEQEDMSLRKRNHDLRNEINSASLAIHLSQKQMQIGRVKEAEESLSLAIEALTRLDKLIDQPK
ncbi:hypothetical protein LF1_16480 [Rubripirellula obstinata]|uniref:Uncharacterized protein n=1 Tax=Rubripirellula obstinata TaxID=406547 RepID=A0A5B1CHS1_9BACT|nr:hypothetical protein [Rubripirellula obstinata]KAA1259120.1 hypothetical protein LF1_16480 [Rubripirellula obstinata]